MSTKFIRFVAVLAILVSIVGITGVARADPAGEETAVAASASPATSPWFVGWVDKPTVSPGVGAWPSIAYNPVNGLPYISYYDATNGNLMLASPVSSGGNCGDNNLWWCRVVDGNSTLNNKTNGVVGQYSSIAFWNGTIDPLWPEWKLGISYHDTTNNALKVAIWTQGLMSGSWAYTTIRSTNAATNGVGTYTSLKFTSDGIPQVTYYSWISTLGYLTYAYPVSSGGNCGEGVDLAKWHCDTVDSGTGVGKYASLDLDNDNQVYLAYYDEGNGNLKYAYYGGIGNCGSGSAWICSTVDSTGTVGLFASLKAPQSTADHPHIAYYDKTTGKLKYATPASGGNCGTGAWQCNNIDSMGAGLLQAGISMAYDKNGYPLIAYMDASQAQAPSTLKIARPVGAVDEEIGNCGDVPNGYLFQVWQCDTIDNAAYGQGNVDVAAYTSVAVSPNGLGIIAYLEDDNYYDIGSLKVAYQRLQVFLPLITR